MSMRTLAKLFGNHELTYLKHTPQTLNPSAAQLLTGNITSRGDTQASALLHERSRGACHTRTTQRAQYPLNKEYTLNCRGLNMMIKGIFLN